MFDTVGWSLVTSLAINGVMFLIAFWRKSDKLTDASYALSFIALSLFSLSRSNGGLYSIVGTLLVCIWAVRIGSFLLYRVIRSGKDRRFDGMREHFLQFGKFWLGQAITVWILMLPATLAFSRNNTWTNVAYVGLIVWLAGWIIESIADLQKYRFTHNPAHKNQWIDSGLWRYSRHPNYFGEILVWLGIYLYALPGLSGFDKLAGAVSPVFITLLLVFVSGIPILEKSADKRWGAEAAYRVYKKHTSVLLPLPKNFRKN